MNDIKYYDTSYQYFYEDKILLMEFELTPLDVLEFLNNNPKGLGLKSTINNKKCWVINDIHNNNDYNKKYTMFIRFIMFNEIIGNYSIPNISVLPNNCWSFYFDRFIEFTYKHQVILSWEEITDRSYLNFIINSASAELSQYINKKYENKIKLVTDNNNMKIFIVPQ